MAFLEEVIRREDAQTVGSSTHQPAGTPKEGKGQRPDPDDILIYRMETNEEDEDPSIADRTVDLLEGWYNGTVATK